MSSQPDHSSVASRAAATVSSIQTANIRSGTDDDPGKRRPRAAFKVTIAATMAKRKIKRKEASGSRA